MPVSLQHKKAKKGKGESDLQGEIKLESWDVGEKEKSRKQGEGESGRQGGVGENKSTVNKHPPLSSSSFSSFTRLHVQLSSHTQTQCYHNAGFRHTDASPVHSHSCLWKPSVLKSDTRCAAAEHVNTQQNQSIYSKTPKPVDLSISDCCLCGMLISWDFLLSCANISTDVQEETFPLSMQGVKSRRMTVEGERFRLESKKRH